MKICFNPAIKRRKTREHGAAAIELAFILPILIVFLTFPFFYARCYWHYTVAQKAAQDAARYLSMVPAAEMRSPELALAAANVAIEIAKREMAELAPGTTIKTPQAKCDGFDCGFYVGQVPEKVRVGISFGMVDTMFGVVETGRYGLLITADVTLRYVGT